MKLGQVRLDLYFLKLLLLYDRYQGYYPKIGICLDPYKNVFLGKNGTFGISMEFFYEFVKDFPIW